MIFRHFSFLCLLASITGVHGNDSHTATSVNLSQNNDSDNVPNTAKGLRGGKHIIEIEIEDQEQPNEENSDTQKIKYEIDEEKEMEGRSLNELFEGDIIATYDSILENYGEDVVAELENEGILDKQPQYDDDNIQRNIVTYYRWNNRVNDIVQIPYQIASSFSSNDKAKIRQAIGELSSRSKVVKFVPWNYQQDYIFVMPSNGCSSFVGKIGGRQEINLGDYCVASKGVIQHEFIHALGIYHTQARPDRDQYVTIRWSNVKGGQSNTNFHKQRDSSTLGNGYDYGSVMHYNARAFTKNGLVTIEPKKGLNGKVMGQRLQADYQDILNIRLLYQCQSGSRTLAQYYANHCTNDCKCWENEVGCNGNNNACQGSLVCSSNRCVNGNGGGKLDRYNNSVQIKIGTECMSVNRKKNNIIVPWNCYNGLNQNWVYDAQGKTLKSMIVGVNLCLDSNSSLVSAKPCNGSFSQKWYLDKTIAGNIMMIRDMGGKCLRKNSSSWKIELTSSCFFRSDQRFYFK